MAPPRLRLCRRKSEPPSCSAYYQSTTDPHADDILGGIQSYRRNSFSSRQNSLKDLDQCIGRRHVRAVTGVQLVERPTVPSGSCGKPPERALVGVPHALNVDTRQRHFGLQMNWLLEALDRLQHAEFCDPG